MEDIEEYEEEYVTFFMNQVKKMDNKNMVNTYSAITIEPSTETFEFYSWKGEIDKQALLSQLLKFSDAEKIKNDKIDCIYLGSSKYLLNDDPIKTEDGGFIYTFLGTVLEEGQDRKFGLVLGYSVLDLFILVKCPIDQIIPFRSHIYSRCFEDVQLEE
ncbi:hypothetical protein A0H76_2809 [Hepatospora eriocheir]|uniref:Uncharacterized protein n=1 Tax=Hepatospora eriocheir TaxID=1081669 RepID=A0A1X0QJD3_9MICR|nr:hypothetical protein A0H76_2809 [Hepatospora eriocheir]